MTAAARRRPTAQRSTTEQGQGSGSQARDPEPRYLAVGRIVAPHGIRGEVRVEVMTDDPHRFGLLQSVFLGQEEQEPVPWLLESYRLHRGYLLLKLARCDDRSAAETLRGYLVQVPWEQALPLEPDEYYEHQILGLEVWTVSGDRLGQVTEIIYTGANDVYVVQDAGSAPTEILIPALEDVILEVDLDAGRLLVQLPDGLV